LIYSNKKITELIKNINNKESFRPGIHATVNIFAGCNKNNTAAKKENSKLKKYLFKKIKKIKEHAKCNRIFVV
jgi:hypothetical protein